ncbi:hypothetical protein IMW82_12860 [Rhodanobacter sp. B2A1Ga4]|uniref:hypothetical protein n=1 Tax=Rhodanobacter sp. B2A1Ga4 TaxID=2778647 RepID=UPI001B39729E|nr:hypothetical protein [Rhodanobacter sp. B2A1Ga4]MBQ4855561.1 hypothetical protein [Rhodanobacter sp. B2A1Ga4]
MFVRFALIVLGMLLVNSAIADGLPIPPQPCASQWNTMGRKAYQLGAMNASPEIARLMVNAGDGKLDEVRRQLRAMPSADASRWRQAAMITAVWAGQSGTVDALLYDGADANAVAQIPNFGKATMDQMKALDPQLFRMAEKTGAVDEGASRTSGPALSIAVECGDVATVNVLLHHQADAKPRPATGTADVLLWATVQGEADIVQALLDHGADPCMDDRRITQAHRKHPDRPVHTLAQIGTRARLPVALVARLRCPAIAPTH